MLSHRASNASRPKRAKSAPSLQHRAAVGSETESIDPEKARQDALTAATLAYERANPNPTARNPESRHSEATSSIDIDDRAPLGRRQSVRFAGPNAVPTRTRSITRRRAPNHSTSHESQQSQITGRPSELLHQSDEVSFNALPEDFNENFVASEPSSYRRLRKAKSMFSPGKTTSGVFGHRTIASKRSLQHRSWQSSGGGNEPLRVQAPRLKRTFSFVRGVTDHISTRSQRDDTNDAAIQLARDTYLQQLEQQRLKEQPSFFGLGQRHKPQKAFRRTVRTSSTNSYGTAISSPLPSTEPGKTSRLSFRARSMSQNLKQKIKRVFKRPSTDEPTIPVQHLDATQPHYGVNTKTFNGSESAFALQPEPDCGLLRRVNSQDSSLRGQPIHMDETSRPGSALSVKSEDEDPHDRSRVTSWTNSTAANTINMPLFVDRKRLSVIKEDAGPHQPSSFSHDLSCENVRDRYANFRQTINQDGAGSPEAKRIFSALQRQIEESNRKAASEKSQRGVYDQLDPQERHHQLSVPTRQSSAQQSIRRMKTASDSRTQRFDHSMPDSSGSDVHRDIGKHSNLFRHGSFGEIDQSDQTNFEEMREDLTPQEIANINESSPSSIKRPFREVKSAFFPPSMHIERSNISPYRRAMYARSEERLMSQSNSARRKAGGKRQAVYGSVAGTASIYSQSSDGQGLHPNSSSVSVARSEGNNKDGTGTVVNSPTLPQTSAAGPFFPRRYSSGSSSAEWRSFMGCQMASAEKDARSPDHSTDDLSIRDKHHKRENAQLNGGDVAIGSLRTLYPEAKQPLGEIQGNAISHRRSYGGGHSTALRNGNPGNENSPLQSLPESPPNLAHNIKEKPSLVSRTNTPSNLRHQDSGKALTPFHDATQKNIKSGLRHSPERAERLRRMKSSSVVTLRISPRLPYGEAGGTDEVARALSTEAGMNTKLVNRFLKGRRKDMGINEEDTTEPAFI